MNKKRNTILALGMVSLALFGIIIVIMMYWKNNDVSQSTEKLISVYVAKKTIGAGEKISLDQLKIQNVPVSTPGAEQLLIADVSGMYALQKIEVNEMLRSEKLTRSIPASEVSEDNDNETIQSSAGKETVTLSSNVFKNFDDSLKAGERIDILGIKMTNEQTRKMESRYVAINVEVVNIKKSHSAPKEQDKEAKEPALQEDVKIVLALNPIQLNRMLSYYYESQQLNQERPYNPDNNFVGHLWMAKTSGSKEQEAEKMRLMGMGMGMKKAPIRTVSKPLPPLVLPPKPKQQDGIVVYEQ